MEFEDPALLAEFAAESHEHLAVVEERLLKLEAEPNAVDPGSVNEMFRGVHSIKGAASFMGLEEISRLSHSFENVLGAVRQETYQPTSDSIDVMLRATDRLTELIDAIEASNETDQSDLCQALDQLLSATPPPTSTAKTTAGLTEVAKTPAAPPSRTAKPDITPAAPAASVQLESSPAAKDNAAPLAKTAKPKSEANNEASIRVNLKVLDQLMNLAGELVLSRNRLIRTVGEIHADPRLDEVAAGIDQVTTSLQEAVMMTRMQPIGQVFNRFPRIIRDLSASLDKKIDLRLDGVEVEIDRTIIEAIGDPLTHLIRNSCDHGVETPEVRVAAGKPQTGNIHLKAYHQAGKVFLEIVDDGAGIDPERLKAKAIENEILTVDAAARMSDREAINLIFAPGFSTAKAITNVSGRGVGMDVVRTNIEQIGGSVEVESELGRGSTIRITLPLTLAIIPAMIVSVGEQSFALPQSCILELVQIDGGEKTIDRVNQAEVLRLRGSLYPLVRLRDVLGLSSRGVETSVDDHPERMIVIDTGRIRFAVAVDDVIDSEDIVVKPLGRHLHQLPLLAGSTILGDGRVALILDATGLANQIDLADELMEVDEDAAGQAGCTKGLERLVLVSTSANDWFAVSMDIVKRIERVRNDQIECVGGQEVLQYRGSTLPLIDLHEGLKTQPVVASNSALLDACQAAQDAESQYSFILIFDVYGHETGLVAPQLHDILDCDLQDSTQSSSEEGVAGIVTIKGHSTRLLDLYGLTEKLRPAWFEQRNLDQDKGPLRIFVVEDSGFFRNHLSKTLREEGHEVSEAVDGMEGYEKLSEMTQLPDIVITDFEMPRMTGIELTRKLRGEERYAKMPIIALTSLADEESLRIGREAGVDDYQVKMNKPALLASIARLA